MWAYKRLIYVIRICDDNGFTDWGGISIIARSAK